MEDLMAVPRARRARRFDPDRKDRIIDAALDVIADHGVRGTTHRLIAAAADVPLGSLTYHFGSLDDLLVQAFTKHASRMAIAYERHFDGVRTPDHLVQAIADLVHDAAADRDSAVSFELYLAAVHNPALRTVTQAWMETSRAVLHRHLEPVTARGVDALIEGLIIHSILSTAPVDRSETMLHIERALRPGTSDPAGPATDFLTDDADFETNPGQP